MLQHGWWHKTKQICLDTIFPPTERSLLVRSLSKDHIENIPAAESVDIEWARAAFDYQHKATRAIVQAAKYDNSPQAAQIMAHTLCDELVSLCQKQRVFSQDIGLVPVPLSNQRLKTRGFNQCQRITKHMCKQLDHLNSRPVLNKVKETKPQAKLSKKERKTNVRNCFQLQPGCDLAGEHVIIIDDVITTGATIQATHQALRAGNPDNVLALAFAH